MFAWGALQIADTFEEFCEQVRTDGVQEVVPEELPDNRHYHSPYCKVDFGSPTMDIQYENDVLRLDFSTKDDGE